MVIPLGAGDMGPPPPVGPPPAELLPRMRKIKVCLIMMILSIVVKLVTGILLFPTNAFAQVYSSLSMVLLVIIGIWLLKDDPMFSGIYRCLVTTCCGGCTEQCNAQAGVSCLCSWFFCCLLVAVFGLLPLSGSDLMTVIVGIQLIADPSKAIDPDTKWGLTVRSTEWLVVLSLFTAATCVGLLAEIFGGWQGMKGFSELAELTAGGGLMGGGDGQGADSSGGRGGFAGGGYGGGARQPGLSQPQQPAGGPGQPPRPPEGFQPFAGQGQRLGG